MIDTNVALKLTPAPPQVRVPPRPKRPEPRFLSEEEYQRLLRVRSYDPRNAAIVEVLPQTGMRLSELARLTIHDVELPRRINCEPDNTGSVRVRRKGGKEATIPLNYKACQALAAWLKVRPRVDHASRFVTKFHTPMSKRAIQYTVRLHMREAGIQNASTHTVRHTMTTHHIARGTDFETIYGGAGSCQPGDYHALHRAGQAGSAEGAAGACTVIEVRGISVVDIDYSIAMR